jgi:gliding motility-associated protein GldL
MAAKSKVDWLHTAVSWGASIVIIGVLFKILHIGGIMGNYLIGVGLAVEAMLFFVTGFFPPKPEPEWEKVYPELTADFNGLARPRPVAQAAVAVPTYSNTAALDKMMTDAKIGPELIESLATNLRSFGDKMASISRVADAADVTNEFTEKLKLATAGFDGLNQAFGKATAQLVQMGESKGDAEAYQTQVNALAKNLSALNSVYELELQDSTTHLKSMNKFHQNLSLTMSNFNESMDDSKQFKDEVAKLAKNLASLNAIYGNMLTAMNQPRV